MMFELDEIEDNDSLEETAVFDDTEEFRHLLVMVDGEYEEDM